MSALIDECLDCLSSSVQMNIETSNANWRANLPSKLSDSSLSRLGENLTMDSNLLEGEAKFCLRKILQAIHDRARVPIDRFCVSGSVGHQPDNALDAMGFDVSVFVDCSLSHGGIETERSEHAECRSNSAEKIYEAIKAMVSSTACNCDHLGLHFEMDGYQFHLAVTPSFGHRMHLQRKAVWDIIEAKDKDNQLTQNDLDRFSMSLHETTTVFMHLGDPSLHSLVRLARLWRSKVLVEQGCGELSTFAAVLVMMRCIENEKAVGMSISIPTGRGLQAHTFPVKKVFMDFLSCLGDLDAQAISYQRFYEPDLIPERHMSRKPYILDPVNPWRNVIHNMTAEGIECVKNYAKSSLKLCESAGTSLGDVFVPQRAAGRGA